jgi:hypothetical protein
LLKETLSRIAKQDFALPVGADEYTLVLNVVEALGSTDPELRDELGYNILSNWLLDKKILQHDQLVQLLQLSVSDEMLFKVSAKRIRTASSYGHSLLF